MCLSQILKETPVAPQPIEVLDNTPRDRYWIFSPDNPCMNRATRRKHSFLRLIGPTAKMNLNLHWEYLSTLFTKEGKLKDDVIIPEYSDEAIAAERAKIWAEIRTPPEEDEEEKNSPQ